MDLRKTISDVFQAEIKALKSAEAVAHEDIIKAVEKIDSCSGKLVVTGVGKSAFVAQKMVATLNSLGVTSSFMHTADALHGDMGMLNNNDCLLIVSKRGVSEDLDVLMGALSRSGVCIICLVSNSRSPLINKSDVSILIPIEEEADEDNIVPTASVMAHMSICDAIAICLKKKRNIRSKDFAKLHPSGSLGKRLSMKAELLCEKGEIPSVGINDNLQTIVYEITSKRLGATCVLDNEEMVGIITDGDLRRFLSKNQTNKMRVTAEMIMTKDPMKVDGEMLAYDALKVMNEKKITQLLVHRKGEYLGLIHLHDIIKLGIV